MKHSHFPVNVAKILAILGILCCVAFFSLIDSNSPRAYAASIKLSTSLKQLTTPLHSQPNDVPDAVCLDVTATSVTGVTTVSVSNPPGGAVQFNTYLYVISKCTGQVSNITVVGTIVSQCPNNAKPTPKTFTFNVPYPLYKGAGTGQQYKVTDSCIVFENGVPTSQVLPTSISLQVDASGSYTSGQPGQDAVAPGITIGVW